MAYPTHGAQAMYGASGQHAYAWDPMQGAGWGAQQHQAPQPQPQGVGSHTAQDYAGQGGAEMYGAYPGYVGHYAAGEGAGQYAFGAQQYGSGDPGQYGYASNQQSWGVDQQQWGWDQTSGGDAGQAPAYRGRGGSGGPPAFGSKRGGHGRGGPSAPDGGNRGGREGPPAFGSGRGGPPAFGGGRGGPPAFGSGREGPPAFGSGMGGPPAFGSGREGPPAFGSGWEGPPAFGSDNEGPPAFGGGRGGTPAFGSGRGGPLAFGSGRGGPPAFGGGRGSRMGNGNMEQGRGGSMRGRGRGMGDGGAGRGRGRGGGAGGGPGDRNRGRGAPGNARGRGGRAGNGAAAESVTVADTGVGLSSIGDLIKSAQQRRLQGMSQGLSSKAPLSSFVERWKSFSRDFVDCGNPISNLECSLKASKLDLLQLKSETDLLFKVSNTYNIFTSTLVLIKKFAPLDHRFVETAFLARGLGLNKKAAKADCYEKAHRLLMDCSVNEIMSQVDTDEATLRKEIDILHKENPKGFMELLKKTNEIIEVAQEGTPSPRAAQAQKRKAPAGGAAEYKSTKKARPLMASEDYLEIATSLAPKKKQGILLQRSVPLHVKLAKLKELLKEEGITKLHIVPKIDQFAHKTAITIRNVYKYINTPSLGNETKTPLFCEIYFDDTWVACSEPHFKKNAAMHQAYCHFTDMLCSESVEDIARHPRRWSVAMELMPDICNVVTKWQGEDNDSLHTSNLANMRQMMQAVPQLKFPIHKMVLTEHETDKNIENVFKSLELSATRNLVLLECEILRNSDQNFTCNISLQGKVMASKVHAVKNAAKRLASEAVMNQLQKTNDFIYVSAAYVGQTYSKEDLFKKAQEKKDSGAEPSKCLMNIVERVLVKKTPENLTPEAQKRFEEDWKGNYVIEDLPENVAFRPLLPYLALVIYDIIDDYYEKLSLEDIIFEGKGMARSQREVLAFCAARMGMRVNTKVRNKEQASLLRRCVNAQDMSKILQIHGGTSGRYKLTKCQNPCSQEVLDNFQEEYLAIYQAYKDSRDLEVEDVPVQKVQPQVPALPARPPSKKEKPPLSAWENDEPLNFNLSPAVRAAGPRGPRGPRPVPPAARPPTPLMAARPQAPPPQRALRPPSMHPLNQPPRQMLARQSRPPRGSSPGPRVGGHFQY